MKNKEKYAKEFVEWALDNCEFGISKENGKIVPCLRTLCEKCIFKHERGKRPWILCSTKRKQWANAEYKEPKVFTDREKSFVKLFPEIKYLARDEEGKLFAYRQKPFKDEEEGWWTCDDDTDILFEISSSFGDFLKFKSIDWDDEEPTSREEILEGQKMNNDELKKDILSIVKGAMLEADELPFIETTDYIADALIAAGVKFDAVVSHEGILGKEKDGD